MMTNNNDVKKYLAQFNGETIKRLELLRCLVRETSPDAIEGISYGLIGFKRNNKPLVYFGGFAKHIGFYATPNGHKAFAEDFAKFKQGKGSVQLPLDQPLPVELLKRVVVYRNQQTDI